VNAVYDVNQDGWMDLIVVDFPGKPTWWFENPKQPGKIWKRHMATPVTNNESPTFTDVDRDGRPELVAGVSPDSAKPDGSQRHMALISPVGDSARPWRVQAISEPAAPGTKKYSHGLGVGDINNDGHLDVLVTAGWWQNPGADISGLWKFHPAPFGDKAAQMYVYDFDGDGDNDVLSSSAHNFGIWWHEQLEGGKWKTHTIDKSFSQTHALVLADINGDGLPDFVTGKRWWAHGGRDPGGDQPAVFYWYELKRAVCP